MPQNMPIPYKLRICQVGFPTLISESDVSRESRDTTLRPHGKVVEFTTTALGCYSHRACALPAKRCFTDITAYIKIPHQIVTWCISPPQK